MSSDPTTCDVSIFRFDPSVDVAPRYESIKVPREKYMRVLDVLDYAVENCGLSVGYRYFCGVKRCGLCGVSVNGKPVLACWEEAHSSMVIEPLAKMQVIRDLVVDRSAFEGSTIDLNSCVVPTEPYGGFPAPLTHADFRDAFPLMNCIECYVCTASCPAVPDVGPLDFHGRDFVGPGTLVQIAKAALHPMDNVDRSALLETAGTDNCMSCGRCEEVCPNGIPILSGAILPLRAVAGRGPRGLAMHPAAFADNVRRNGNVNSATLFLRTRGWRRVLMSLPLLLKMFVRGKTRVFAKVGREPRQRIAAMFEQVARGRRGL